MTGVVLETLSWRKLSFLGICLLIALIVFFLIGGLIAPAPSHVQTILGTKCLDQGRHAHKKQWFIPRGEAESCSSLSTFDDLKIMKEHITPNQIVFAFWIPGPKGGKQLDMSRWFQNIIAVLQLEIAYDEDHPMSENATLEMEVKLAYRDLHEAPTDWKLLAESVETRKLDCTIDEDQKKAQNHYKCNLVPLFELGSCHYDYYLVNLRIPVHEHKYTNMAIGKLQDIWVVAISQTGGFTKVWLSLKTVMFFLLLPCLIWFWRRIMILDRSPKLLERTLFALGIALSVLNLPLEWMTLWINMPFMLLLSDIRQGVFYAVLLSFWLIFVGEHMIDQMDRNRISTYSKHLAAVGYSCVMLFVFEMCERGVQLKNPFFSIWATKNGTDLALASVILAGVAASLYFIFLCYMVFSVFKTISIKKTVLPHMSSSRRKYYKGLIYRFKFLMLATLVCAALTVIFFIISQVSEGQWKWGEESPSLEYTSAFFTGVYGMWNVYVFGLLCMYAPSHKTKQIIDDTADNSMEEEVQLTQIPSDASQLSSFLKKSAVE
ncbi:protein wntless-like [Argonauta hians]